MFNTGAQKSKLFTTIEYKPVHKYTILYTLNITTWLFYILII